MRRGPGDLLSLETSDPATGVAFARWRERLLDLAHASPPSGESVLPALAALSVGDAGPAAALLAGWAGPARGVESEPAFGTLSSGFTTALLAARYLAWTGDAADVIRLWGRVRVAHARAMAASAVTPWGGRVLHAHTLREVVPLAEAAGDAAAGELATDSQNLLRDPRAAAFDEDAAEFPIAAALGFLDAHPPARRRPASREESPIMSPDLALRVWAALALGDTAGADAWRAILHADQPGGAGLRPGGGPTGPHDEDGMAPLIIAGAVFGMAGVAPDAPKLRLRLRPQLPDFWNELRVRNLAMGANRFDISIRRHGDRRSYSVEQTAGAYPVRLILEIPVPNATARAMEVDGRPASLDIRPFGPGFLIPVQLVLDEVRTVAVEGEGY
jgi:hypothetical protein